MKSRVLVAMSGGVDSAVAARLLQDQGYEVVGATIKTWSRSECRDERAKGCCSLSDLDDARQTARVLGIPYYVLDLSGDFKERVMDEFLQSYRNGQTPNPCILCNHDIKFGVFLDKATEIGAEFIATGHYARKGRDAESGRWYIRESVDPSKDQSYVLFGLTQNQLARTLLPVGEYQKPRIREIAAQIGLRVSDKPDSQEICFVPGRYTDWLREQDPTLPGEGVLRTTDGKILGTHQGHWAYTIGQRKRIDATDRTPYYVVEIRAQSNEVVVGKKSDLDRSECLIDRTNWMIEPAPGRTYSVKIRSRHPKAAAQIIDLTSNSVRIRFMEPESALTPGQAAVFYDGEAMVGGGWIRSVESI